MLLVVAMILVQGLWEHSRGVKVGFALGVAAAAVRSSGFSAFQRLTAPNRLGLVIRRFRPGVSPVWDGSVALDEALRISSSLCDRFARTRSYPDRRQCLRRQRKAIYEDGWVRPKSVGQQPPDVNRSSLDGNRDLHSACLGQQSPSKGVGQGAQGGEPTDRSLTDGVQWAAGHRLTQISTATPTSIWFATSAYRSTSTSGARILTTRA